MDKLSTVGLVCIILFAVLVLIMLATAIYFHQRQIAKGEARVASLVFTFLSALFPPFFAIPVVLNLDSTKEV